VRADRALAFLAGRPERVLLVVTHGFFLRTVIARIVMREALSGFIHTQFQSALVTQNTGITAIRLESSSFESEPRWRVFTFNDHAHLG
jgi:broad specificity phosphatase PhoE